MNTIRLKCVFICFFSIIYALTAAALDQQFFPPSYDFKLEHDWLTMPDGVRLSVDYYKPIPQREGEKFPVVLEVLPYRKDDSFAMRDYPVYSYLARRGIVGVRVDIRGTGSSDGRVSDREYSDQELEDIREIIKQLAAFPWSNGNIGMQGKSWSAINAIITAMQRPRNLKALLVMHGSNDLYGNDIHDWDGGLHIDMFSLEIDTENMMPQSPDYPIDENYFHSRFNVKPWIFLYLHHQRDGDFWRKNRSLFTDYNSINIPIYAIAGLLDGYRDTVPEMLMNMTVPMKAEMGPWNHAFPHNGVPGPNYEWRQNAVRWWQHWLNGKETGIMREPLNVIFLRGYVAPDTRLRVTPGSFVSVNRIPKVTPLTFILQNENRLGFTDEETAILKLKYQPDVGFGSMNWWGEATGDMREVEKGSLIFESAPLAKTQYILGFPEVNLTVAGDKPLADWIVRLEDLAPDGSVSLVTGGLINSSQRLSRLHPQALPINRFVEIYFPLRYTTWTYQKGHRIRLAISNAQFPMIWPTPHNMTTQIKVGNARSSVLVLPFVTRNNLAAAKMLPVEASEERPGASWIHALELTPFRISYDRRNHLTIANADESMSWKIDDRFFTTLHRITYTVDTRNPANATFSGQGSYEIKIGKRLILGQTLISIVSDGLNFNVRVRRELRENNVLVGEREWDECIPRDFE
jgi:uncharacterized protein